jgi:putative membrane protein
MMFWWVGDILSGFRVEGFFSALFGSIIYSIASWFLSSLTEQPRGENV